MDNKFKQGDTVVYDGRIYTVNEFDTVSKSYELFLHDDMTEDVTYAKEEEIILLRDNYEDLKHFIHRKYEDKDNHARLYESRCKYFIDKEN